MTEEGNDLPQRPNAKYKLSRGESGKDPYGEDRLVFHYNRERRLEKAPQAVRDMYTDNPKMRPGLLRSLTGDRPRASLFFVIVILCVLIFALSMFGKLDSSYSLGGHKIEIAGTRYEGTTIVVLRKTVKKNEAQPYSGAVEIAISPLLSGEQKIEEEFPVFYHRVFFSLEAAEEYRFVVPFDTPDLLAILQTETGSVNIKFKPE
jgi:hypothetical protein